MKILKKHHLLMFFLLTTLVFSLLLLKNPFSERNLISNLEPFPDTIHYLNPPISLLRGKGMVIEREGRTLVTAVPPLYSLTILPVFIFNDDVRMFYFINVLLSFTSFVVFFKVLTILIKNNWIILLILFFYVTNYFIYWFPSIAMAENLILTLFMISLLLLVQKSSRRSIIAAGFVGVAFYATKYASISLTLTFILMFFIKVLFEFKKHSLRKIILFISSTLLVFLIFAGFEYLIKDKNTLSSFFILLSWLFPAKDQIMTGMVNRKQDTWFSFNYFDKNLYLYLYAIVGKPLRFLWDSTPLVPSQIGILGIIGLIINWSNKYMVITITYLILSLVSTIIFLSTFYSIDARYIYHAIPVVLLGFGLFLGFLYKVFELNKLKSVFYFILILIFIFYFSQSAIRIKSQIMINLKYAETPWYYITVKEINQYFDKIKIQKRNPVLISALPPYYIDFFSNGKYSLLPLSRDQEFRAFKDIAWGKNDYSDLIKLYKKYIIDGYEVYVSKYGLGNEGYLHASYEKIFQNFKVTEVMKGCFEVCNLYRVELKNE